MKYRLPQVCFSKIMRAIVEFDLIQEDDNILIGLSGGKDSLLLTYALAMLRERLKKHFDLRAFTVDPMFSSTFDPAALKTFTESLKNPWEAQAIDNAEIIK